MPTKDDARHKRRFSAIILAAGAGKRMRSKIPKVMLKIRGKPIIGYVVDLARKIGSGEIVVVTGKDNAAIKKTIGRGARYAIQDVPHGTGDAARRGIALTGSPEVMILCGDVPVLRASTARAMIAHHKKTKAALTLLTCTFADPAGYGRIVRRRDGSIARIVEHRDASARHLQISEINSGIYYGRRRDIARALESVDRENDQREFYLTDIVRILRKTKKKISGFRIGDEREITGVNSRADLARVRAFIKNETANAR